MRGPFRRGPPTHKRAEGTPDDIEATIDGALLVDLWEDLVLPRGVRAAWQPLIDEVLAS